MLVLMTDVGLENRELRIIYAEPPKNLVHYYLWRSWPCPNEKIKGAIVNIGSKTGRDPAGNTSPMLQRTAGVMHLPGNGGRVIEI
jgi:hypothetical protein